VAYYFSHGTTKAEMLVQFLKEVLDACQNAGLQVLAIVSGMGANNVKALKLLGASEIEAFFKFHNKEIGTVFDPPPLLKFTRNLFHKCDVQVKSEPLDNQLSLIAK
jgi:hypothetical protein